MFLPYISFILAFRALEYIKRYWETVCEESIYPSDLLTPPPYGSNWGHKIADFVFLPYISFILAFRALECIKRYWETYVKSQDSRSDLPPDPLL